MWEYDSFVAKARLYFDRAQEHPSADDDVFALWLLLGLEFLLRAPLAKVHASLLADPTGDAIMYAAGLPLKPDAVHPKSIPTKTVILRLATVIAEFDKERQDDATFLTGLRNQELHSGDVPLEIDPEKWLPHFTRILVVICSHLNLSPASLVGQEIFDHGRSLADMADQKVQHEVARRIAAAKRFFDRLRPEEIEARKASIPTPYRPSLVAGITVAEYIATRRSGPKYPHELVNCPACGTEIPMRLQSVRATNQRLEDDELVRDVIYIAIELPCPVCDLELANTAEIRAAGIPQQYVRRERESLEQRFAPDWGAYDDYGND